MLQETGLPYEPHLVRFEANEQMSPEFLSLNPYGKIPAILDPNGPGGKPFALFESGAILIYLADKARQFMSQGVAGRYETIQWLMIPMGGVGPMFGQLGFFNKLAGKNYQDKRPRDRYVAESKRLRGVLNQRLAVPGVNYLDLWGGRCRHSLRVRPSYEVWKSPGAAKVPGAIRKVSLQRSAATRWRPIPSGGSRPEVVLPVEANFPPRSRSILKTKH